MYVSKNKPSWYAKLLCCLAACLLMLSMHARGADPETIAVRLLAPSPHACIGQPILDLEAVLTNTSAVAVEISPDGVNHAIRLAKYQDGNEVDSGSILRDVEPRSWIQIAPHQSIIVPFSQQMSLKNMKLVSMLSSSGLFEVSISFEVITKEHDGSASFKNSVRSNGALFLLSECSSGTGSNTPDIPLYLLGSPTDTLLHESGHVDWPKPQ